MKRYIRGSGYIMSKKPYPYGSTEYDERVQECIDKMPKFDNVRDIVNFNGVIFQISENGFVQMSVVDEWGHWGRIYGSMWEYAQNFLKYGGDIELVTFTDDKGNTYTPYKNRKSIHVTFADGSEVDLPRGKAENLFRNNTSTSGY